MPHRLRHAICNEVFENWTFADACRAIRKAGYSGIEIAPFTLAEDPATLTPAGRRECRDIMASEGLQFVGLHWLMVSPKGLHVTTPDADLRCRSWQHIRHLIDLCADLGPDGILVFGSPKQRATTGGLSRVDATRHFVEGLAASTGGLSRVDATRHFVEGLAAVAPHAGQRGVTILMEALPLGQCDVVTSLDEAAALVRQIGHPAVRTMFDCHNAIDETEPHAALVERYYDLIDRKSTRLNSSHLVISYAVFCLKKKKKHKQLWWFVISGPSKGLCPLLLRYVRRPNSCERHPCAFIFFFNDTATTEIYTLSLHDALPIYKARARRNSRRSRNKECRRPGKF